MKLYVVRHAIAGIRDPEQWPDDAERPLTARGRRRFKKAARGIARIAPTVDVMLSSPYVRAWQTAQILHEDGGWPAPEPCEVLQTGQPEEIVRALEAYASLETVAIVGHEPYLSAFVGHLLSPQGGAAIEFKKGAFACVSMDEHAWRLLWLLQPKALRLLA